MTSIFGDSEIADCILDWRNPVSQASTDGAETAYYSGLDPPYLCKNGPFDTLQELLLVKDVTPEILSNPMPEGSVPLTELLTVYAPKFAAPVTTAGLVDIESASQQTLQSAFGSVLTSVNIAAIIRYRSTTPFHVPAEIVRVPGLSRSQVQQIYDRLTVAGASVPAAKINLNTARGGRVEHPAGTGLDDRAGDHQLSGAKRRFHPCRRTARRQRRQQQRFRQSRRRSLRSARAYSR